MSKRYKLKRQQRYHRKAWRCPICGAVNRRDHEGLDQCDKCSVHTHTRYGHESGRLFVVEASDESLEFQCWCGERGTFDQLFDDSGLESSCGGLGVLHCRCGGDLCVCHYHGETECLGCEDCEEADDDYDPGDAYDTYVDDWDPPSSVPSVASCGENESPDKSEIVNRKS